jgi:hypothetical protein
MQQSAQHVSPNYFAHLQEHYTVCYSLWYNAPTMLPAGGRPATSWVHSTQCIFIPIYKEEAIAAYTKKGTVGRR